jgi:hypothetical protein
VTETALNRYVGNHMARAGRAALKQTGAST